MPTFLALLVLLPVPLAHAGERQLTLGEQWILDRYYDEVAQHKAAFEMGQAMLGACDKAKAEYFAHLAQRIAVDVKIARVPVRKCTQEKRDELVVSRLKLQADLVDDVAHGAEAGRWFKQYQEVTAWFEWDLTEFERGWSAAESARERNASFPDGAPWTPMPLPERQRLPPLERGPEREASNPDEPRLPYGFATCFPGQVGPTSAQDDLDLVESKR